jgi:hypothetical protein
VGAIWLLIQAIIRGIRRTHIWAERYDRNLTDLFAVQDEITRSIVATVAPEVEEAEMQRVRREHPEHDARIEHRRNCASLRHR